MDAQAPGSSATDRAIVLAAVALAVASLLRLATVATAQLGFPYDLVFETPNLISVELVRAGRNPYDPAVYAASPFHLTMYTPLYHYLVAAFPAHPENPFVTGRVVAAVAMLLAASALSLVNGRRTPPTLALFAAGAFFAVWPVSLNTVFLKTDPLALLFSVAAVLAVQHGRGKPWIPPVCALAALAAVASKQSFVAGGLACGAWLLLVDRRQAVHLAAWATGLGLAFALAAHAIWGPGFWFSTMGAVGQDVSADHALRILGRIYRQPLLAGLLLVTVVVTVDALRTRGWAALTDAPFLLYALASGAVMLATVGKVGSSTNYVIEFALAQLLWIVWWVGPRWPGWVRSHALASAALALCLVADFAVARHGDYAFATPAYRARIEPVIRALRGELAALGLEDPLILVPNTHRLGRALTTRPALNDPFLYRLLWSDGILDLQPMLDSIEAQAFDVILLPANEQSLRPNTPPELLPAIRRSYRPGRTAVGQRFFVRREAAPPS